MNTAPVKAFCRTVGQPFAFRWGNELGRVSISADSELDTDNIDLVLNKTVAAKLALPSGKVQAFPSYSSGLININYNNEYLNICLDSVESSIGLCGGRNLPLIAVFPFKFNIRNTTQYEYIYSASVQKRCYEMKHPTRHRVIKSQLNDLKFQFIHENGDKVVFEKLCGSIILQVKLFKLFYL
jgi:hypothetical protein